MMELANFTGRQSAHDIVYEACKETIESKEQDTLFDVLMKKSIVTNAISADKLKDLCNPAKYLGAASRMVDDVLTVKI